MATRPSVDLWPEVVYPLLEQAHWQRTSRPPHEAHLGLRGRQVLRPVAGVQLDRMMIIAIPLEVAEQLDLDLSTFVDEPEIEGDELCRASRRINRPSKRGVRFRREA